MRKKFSTAAQMEALMDMYFTKVEECNKYGGYMRPSIEGLAHFLDLSKAEFLDYKKLPRFEQVVKRGMLRIEADLEARTLTDEPDVEGLMTDLVSDFGWEPLNDDDWYQIKLMLN